MPATVNIYFDNRMSKDGEWYVKYAVYFEKKQRYFTTGIKLDTEDVEFLRKYKVGLTGGVRDEYRRNLWGKIYGKDGILQKATLIIEQLGNKFSFDTFKEKILSPVNQEKQEISDIFSDMLARASELRKTNNIGDADIYEWAVISLKRFHKRPALNYQDIDKNFLERYEHWMLREGKTPQPKKDKEGNIIPRPGTPASPTTIGMYLRQVRAMYNLKKTNDKSLEESYPFGEDGYIIPSGRNIKKAITIDDIEKIISYTPESGSEHMYRDLWIFSYMSNGINFIDLLRLTWGDYNTKKGTIEFVRSKTKKTKKDKTLKIQIDLFPITTEIIERWGDKRGKYIFPFFTATMLPEKQRDVKRQVVKNTNKYMRRIAAKLGIVSDITTYTARHTFATVLLRSEVPLAFISQKLSHESIKTTQDYLGSFEDDQSKKYLSALLPKKKD